MDYLGVDPSQPALYQAALNNPNLLGPGIDLHPIPRNFSAPSYIVFNFNAAYRVEHLSDCNLQLFVQLNNVFDKAPPVASGLQAFGIFNQYGGTNPAFFDTLGRAWRAGFRLTSKRERRRCRYAWWRLHILKERLPSRSLSCFSVADSHWL